MAGNVSPIPPGYHNITPSIIVKDADAAMAQYKKAFCSEDPICMRSPTCGFMHAEMKICDSIFMLSGEWPNMGMKAPAPNHVSGGLHVYVPDADKAYQRALDAGCQTIMPPANM